MHAIIIRAPMAMPAPGVFMQMQLIELLSGVEFRQKIYLSDGQVDLQNHLSVCKSTCP